MKTKCYRGEIIKTNKGRKVAVVLLEDGRKVFLHKKEMLSPNPFYNEMHWENLLAEKYVKFWAPALLEEAKVVRLWERSKVEEWRAGSHEVPVDIIDSQHGIAKIPDSLKRAGSKFPPSIPDIDRVLKECLRRGWYDMAYWYAANIYTCRSTKLKAKDIFFKGSPGPKGVFYRKRISSKSDKYRIYPIPGLAGSIVYTWWALHGGWHHRGWLAVPFNAAKRHNAIDNVFLACGLEWYSSAELRKLVKFPTSSIVMNEGITMEDVGKRKYYTFDDVVYLSNGGNAFPAGISQDVTGGLELNTYAWDRNWMEEHCERLKIPKTWRTHFGRCRDYIEARTGLV